MQVISDVAPHHSGTPRYQNRMACRLNVSFNSRYTHAHFLFPLSKRIILTFIRLNSHQNRVQQKHVLKGHSGLKWVRLTLQPADVGCPKKCIISTSNHPSFGFKTLDDSWEIFPTDSNDSRGTTDGQSITIARSHVQSHLKLIFVGTHNGELFHRLMSLSITMEADTDEQWSITDSSRDEMEMREEQTVSEDKVEEREGEDDDYKYEQNLLDEEVDDTMEDLLMLRRKQVLMMSTEYDDKSETDDDEEKEEEEDEEEEGVTLSPHRISNHIRRNLESEGSSVIVHSEGEYISSENHSFISGHFEEDYDRDVDVDLELDDDDDDDDFSNDENSELYRKDVSSDQIRQQKIAKASFKQNNDENEYQIQREEVEEEEKEEENGNNQKDRCKDDGDEHCGSKGSMPDAQFGGDLSSLTLEHNVTKIDEASGIIQSPLFKQMLDEERRKMREREESQRLEQIRRDHEERLRLEREKMRLNYEEEQRRLVLQRQQQETERRHQQRELEKQQLLLKQKEFEINIKEQKLKMKEIEHEVEMVKERAKDKARKIKRIGKQRSRLKKFLKGHVRSSLNADEDILGQVVEEITGSQSELGNDEEQTQEVELENIDAENNVTPILEYNAEDDHSNPMQSGYSDSNGDLNMTEVTDDHIDHLDGVETAGQYLNDADLVAGIVQSIQQEKIEQRTGDAVSTSPKKQLPTRRKRGLSVSRVYDHMRRDRRRDNAETLSPLNEYHSNRDTPFNSSPKVRHRRNDLRFDTDFDIKQKYGKSKIDNTVTSGQRVDIGVSTDLENSTQIPCSSNTDVEVSVNDASNFQCQADTLDISDIAYSTSSLDYPLLCDHQNHEDDLKNRETRVDQIARGYDEIALHEQIQRQDQQDQMIAQERRQAWKEYDIDASIAMDNIGTSLLNHDESWNDTVISEQAPSRPAPSPPPSPSPPLSPPPLLQTQDPNSSDVSSLGDYSFHTLSSVFSNGVDKPGTDTLLDMLVDLKMQNPQLQLFTNDRHNSVTQREEMKKLLKRALSSHSLPPLERRPASPNEITLQDKNIDDVSSSFNGKHQSSPPRKKLDRIPSFLRPTKSSLRRTKVASNNLSKKQPDMASSTKPLMMDTMVKRLSLEGFVDGLRSARNEKISRSGRTKENAKDEESYEIVQEHHTSGTTSRQQIPGQTDVTMPIVIPISLSTKNKDRKSIRRLRNRKPAELSDRSKDDHEKGKNDGQSEMVHGQLQSQNFDERKNDMSNTSIEVIIEEVEDNPAVENININDRNEEHLDKPIDADTTADKNQNVLQQHDIVEMMPSEDFVIVEGHQEEGEEEEKVDQENSYLESNDMTEISDVISEQQLSVPEEHDNIQYKETSSEVARSTFEVHQLMGSQIDEIDEVDEDEEHNQDICTKDIVSVEDRLPDEKSRESHHVERILHAVSPSVIDIAPVSRKRSGSLYAKFFEQTELDEDDIEVHTNTLFSFVDGDDTDDELDGHDEHVENESLDSDDEFHRRVISKLLEKQREQRQLKEELSSLKEEFREKKLVHQHSRSNLQQKINAAAHLIQEYKSRVWEADNVEEINLQKSLSSESSMPLVITIPQRIKKRRDNRSKVILDRVEANEEHTDTHDEGNSVVPGDDGKHVESVEVIEEAEIDQDELGESEEQESVHASLDEVVSTNDSEFESLSDHNESERFRSDSQFLEHEQQEHEDKIIVKNEQVQQWSQEQSPEILQENETSQHAFGDEDDFITRTEMNDSMTESNLPQERKRLSRKFFSKKRKRDDPVGDMFGELDLDLEIESINAMKRKYYNNFDSDSSEEGLFEMIPLHRKPITRRRFQIHNDSYHVEPDSITVEQTNLSADKPQLEHGETVEVENEIEAEESDNIREQELEIEEESISSDEKETEISICGERQEGDAGQDEVQQYFEEEPIEGGGMTMNWQNGQKENILRMDSSTKESDVQQHEVQIVNGAKSTEEDETEETLEIVMNTSVEVEAFTDDAPEDEISSEPERIIVNPSSVAIVTYTSSTEGIAADHLPKHVSSPFSKIAIATTFPFSSSNELSTAEDKDTVVRENDETSSRDNSNVQQQSQSMLSFSSRLGLTPTKQPFFVHDTQDTPNATIPPAKNREPCDASISRGIKDLSLTQTQSPFISVPSDLPAKFDKDDDLGSCPTTKKQTAPRYNYTRELISTVSKQSLWHVNFMRKGTQVIKYQHSGRRLKTKTRILKLDSQCTSLSLERVSGFLKRKHKKIQLEEIRWIVFGRNQRFFKNKSGSPASTTNDWRCFSLVLQDETINLEVTNDSDCINWILGLQQFLFQRIMENSRPLYTRGELIFKKLMMMLDERSVVTGSTIGRLFSSAVLRTMQQHHRTEDQVQIITPQLQEDATNIPQENEISIIEPNQFHVPSSSSHSASSDHERDVIDDSAIKDTEVQIINERPTSQRLQVPSEERMRPSPYGTARRLQDLQRLTQYKSSGNVIEPKAQLKINMLKQSQIINKDS